MMDRLSNVLNSPTLSLGLGVFILQLALPIAGLLYLVLHRPPRKKKPQPD